MADIYETENSKDQTASEADDEAYFNNVIKYLHGDAPLAPIRESLLHSMYGQPEENDEPDVTQAPASVTIGLTHPIAQITLENLYALIQAQQRLISAQDREMRRLATRIEQVARTARATNGEIADIYHELDRRVMRRD